MSRPPFSTEFINPPCPLLPEIDRLYRASDLDRFGKTRGPDFYETALHYAQSLWQTGFPAKSILLINRALSVTLDRAEPVFQKHPLPYRAVAWLLFERPEGQFIGNPRRHWQHLATRMVEPNKELRTWRAWACWYLAKTILPEVEHPSDMKQIREESVVEPTFLEIGRHLKRLSPADDFERWTEALDEARAKLRSDRAATVEARIRRIGADELGTVRALAYRIWPAHYPGIITEAQIDYMLAVWYEIGALKREVEERGVCYALIEAGGAGAVGYIGCEPQPGSDVLFLSKLYLLPEWHGHGIGQIGLTWVQELARTRGCRVVRLRVNKANTSAIRAYLRHGFHFVEDLCTDIGSGFVMDDFLMERSV